MGTILIKFRHLFVGIFFALGMFYLLTIDSVFDRGIYLSLKMLSVPLALITLLFIRSNLEQLKQTYNFSRVKVWLYGMFLVYPLLVLISYPYVLAVNASISDDSVVKVGGVIIEKYISTGRAGLSHMVRGQVDNSEKEFRFIVHERNYDLLKEGDTIYRSFYSGGFGIPWRYSGRQPEPDQIIPAL